MTTARDVIAEWLTDGGFVSPHQAQSFADSLMAKLEMSPESVRLELAAKLNPWRPIETAPKWGTKILVAYWHQPANPEAPGFWNAGIKATHWLPLPVPPSEDKS